MLTEIASQQRVGVPFWSAGSLAPRYIGAMGGQFIAPVFDVVTTGDGFEALRSDWDDLYARAGASTQSFQRFGWLKHWADTYLGGADRLLIVTVRQGGSLVAVLPLVVERVFGLKQLAFMGAPVSQYGDALVDGGGRAVIAHPPSLGTCARGVEA